MSTIESLGTLDPVDPRQVWSDESADFTPWLSLPENIARLGTTIGLELEVEATEHDVGPFRADILCKDTITSNWVLIENQLNRTDHVHLGQLITYAAGLNAVTIVWIARQFTDEHRAALDWLNEITDEDFRFFGIEIRAWRIGDSRVAPQFDIIAKPNDWSRDVSRGAKQELTESNHLHLQFWTAFKEFAEEHAKNVRPTKPLLQNWMSMAIGRSGYHMTAVANLWAEGGGNELRAELIIERSQQGYELLLQQKEDIEAQLGEPLTWYSKEGVMHKKVLFRRDAVLEDRERWPEYFMWLVSKLDRLHFVLKPLVRALP